MCRAPRALGVAVAAVALLAALAASLAVGAKDVPLDTVVTALLHQATSTDHEIVRARIPRTLLGLAVGIALGLAGVLMHALTRNPLADPGILGVNAGAAAALVTAVGLLGLQHLLAYLWLSFLGAAAAAVTVYLLGTRGHGRASPARLALAGAAVTAALTAYTSGFSLLDTQAFDRYRFWTVGSLAGRDPSLLWQAAPFFALGVVAALGVARPLNAIALGDVTAQALGVRVGRTRAVAAVAITVLCGTATAVAGPIAFVGLAISHAVRALAGPDHRWSLPYALVLAPTLVLATDIVGRVMARPGEIEVGLTAAMVGAPLFIALVCRRRIPQL
ncbi:iron ABC transporter permease [Longimycelium tulufanense]|uniref:Iron ABC transporter permease n=1 Tax=Longimycelium tulufanense TaxID=907463 RepID=A0A8J3C7K5_9PSEU|nr:iron chelate uptake ABC transporter family permease subunit [Longimycelium tulufanense]GGM49068.1 iron ABC transporter permease [Longimycelium tulufanense]